MAGFIGENFWSMLESESDRRIGAVSTEYDISEQEAYQLSEPTPNSEYLAGDFIFVVPFEKYRTRPALKDYVVVRTNRDGFTRFSLRVAVVVEGVIRLVPVGLSTPAPSADSEKPIGLMIGFYRPVRHT